MSTHEKDTTVMVLGRIQHGVQPVEGSVMILAGCGHYAWMSPRAARAMAKDEDCETQCIDCVPAQLPGEKAGTLPGAMEDAARHLGVPVEEVEASFAAFVASHGGTVATSKDIDL